MQCMVVINSLNIDVSSEILWLAIAVLIGVVFIKYFRKSVVFSLLAFLIISVYASYYTDIGKKAIDTDYTQYSLEEFANNLNLVGE